MTYSFFCPSEGRHCIYDTSSGAVILTGELEAYICDALDPCGEAGHFPEKCPSDIRYELARFASTEVSAAYERIKSYYSLGLIYTDSDKALLRVSGEYSASEALIPQILAECGLSKNDITFI